MKTLAISFVGLVLLLFAVPLRAQENYFDLENCEVCKCMGEHSDIMQAMKWDIKSVKNGMLMVMFVPEEHKAAMQEVHAKMKEVAGNLKDDAKLCGFCKDYMSLVKAGADVQEGIETVAGNITLITSSDPKIVDKIHTVAEKAIAAHAVLVKEKSGKKPETRTGGKSEKR